MTTSLAITTIAAMAAASYLTRIAGVWFLTWFTLTDRLRQGLDTTTAAVLVAIIAPAAIDGDLGTKMALGVSAITMSLSRKPLLAIAIGALAAASTRAIS